jgi:hypothetical protein
MFRQHFGMKIGNSRLEFILHPMQPLKLFIFFAMLSLIGTSCEKFGKASQNCITVSGQIEKQEVTSYQYGTHTIGDYAIRSNVYDLDQFILEPIVLIEGCRINGYQNGAVEGGPDYLEVTSIAIQ